MTKITKAVFYKHKKDIFRLLLLALTAFFCTLPLFIHQGLPLAQDLVFHIFQADQFNKAVNDGAFYPRWVLDSNNGYGSPSFIFYAPLSYYIVSAIKYFIPSLTTAMTVAIWFSFFLSGAAMLFSAERIFGKSGSLISAIVYQILPFHIFDLYIRGTFAELFSFVWFPLIILFMYKMFYSRNNKKAFTGLSISYACLILTHLVSGFILSFVIGAYLIYNFFVLKDKKSFLTALSSLSLGLGLALFYLVPAFVEQRFIHIEYIVNYPIGDYKKNFLFMPDKFHPDLQSFYICLHIAVFLECLLLLFILLAQKKHGTIITHKQRFFVLLFLSAFFLTTPLSHPIWDVMPGFSTLQFPWRWVPMMELSLCLLIGSIFSGVDKAGIISRDQKKRMVLYIMTALFLVSFVMILKSRLLPAEFIKKVQDPEHIKSIMDPPVEYTPVWVTDINKIMSEDRVEKILVISGLAEYSVNEWKSEKRVINIKASSPALLRISTFYYPGWEAEINGNRAQIKIEKESGAMLIDIPEGEYTLELRFVDTPLRYYSKLITLVSFFILVFITIFTKRRLIRCKQNNGDLIV